jgi:hypothetical protein
MTIIQLAPVACAARHAQHRDFFAGLVSDHHRWSLTPSGDISGTQPEGLTSSTGTGKLPGPDDS